MAELLKKAGINRQPITTSKYKGATCMITVQPKEFELLKTLGINIIEVKQSGPFKTLYLAA